MSRAGVRPDISERVMGHVIAGVEGVYDRHSYREEKADALRRLASLIGTILADSDNVVPMQRTGT
jgi:starvation-inducible outer membrane lipoprotein